jgi:hypothetical protein
MMSSAPSSRVSQFQQKYNSAGMRGRPIREVAEFLYNKYKRSIGIS